MVANVNVFWNLNTSANTVDMSYVSSTPKTPPIGSDISNDGIRLIFGKGNEPTSPGLELDNYQGVFWWSPDYPHSKGRFSSGSISYDDLHNKHGEDPVAPGMFIDRHGSAATKNFTVPPFREWIRFEIWGGGGGAGAANYYSGSNGGAGQSSSIFGITAGGGGGGVGGSRVGNINGSVGTAGTTSGSITASVTSYFLATGTSGNPGEAQSARGNVGGNSGNTASILINAEYINQYSVKRVGTEVVVTLTGNVYTEFYSSGTGGARGGRYFAPSPRGTNAGYDGGAPGGGGGSGGWSELKDYDKRDSRGSGGSGGGGAYASFYFERSQMAVGNIIPYTVGAGGAGGIGTYGNGGYGANGVLKVTWV